MVKVKIWQKHRFGKRANVDEKKCYKNKNVANMGLLPKSKCLQMHVAKTKMLAKDKCCRTHLSTKHKCCQNEMLPKCKCHPSQAVSKCRSGQYPNVAKTKMLSK